MSGHGIIINLGSYLPFVFQFNPESVDTEKPINYIELSNIGGSAREKVFTGFENTVVSFTLVLIDKGDPFGVTEEIAYFEALREPDAGLLGIAGSFFGNENYPPPQVLFNWGTGSLVPLVWFVDDVSIKNTNFFTDEISGIIGIPWRSEVTISLSKDEDNIFNKANQISKKVAQIAGSAESVSKEMYTKVKGGRRERSGFYGGGIGGFRV